jgi:cytochrome c
MIVRDMTNVELPDGDNGGYSGAYTGCQSAGKPVSVRRCRPSAATHFVPFRARSGSLKSMNSFELNKILGALLACVLITLSLNITAGALFSSPKPAKPGFDIAVKEAGPGAAGPAEPSQPIEVLLASASAEKGAAAAKQCAACHTFEKGGPNRVGPNLYEIVNHERGTGRGGFNFSAAMKAKGGTWTFDELNKFLKDPRGYIPGTNMTFAGLSRDGQRADVIEYLRKQADAPVDVPKVAAAAPPAGGPAGAAPPAPAAQGAPATAPAKH